MALHWYKQTKEKWKKKYKKDMVLYKFSYISGGIVRAISLHAQSLLAHYQYLLLLIPLFGGRCVFVSNVGYNLTLISLNEEYILIRRPELWILLVCEINNKSYSNLNHILTENSVIRSKTKISMMDLLSLTELNKKSSIF